MATNRKPVVGITQGDGNGIGYEVIIKALSDPRILDSFTPVIYGSSKIFGYYKKLIHETFQMDTNVISSARDAHPKRVNIVNCLPDNIEVMPGQATADSAKSAITSLERAVKDIKAGDIDVLVTAPINKKSMESNGFGHTGHTEYLQTSFNASEVLMFMVSDSMKVGVVTGHIPLKDVPHSISVEKILGKLRLMQASLKRDFCIDDPRIAVLSLNPHSGDGGLLGTEEQDIIIPAIEKAQAEGIMAFGPFSPDGYFGLGKYAAFDATLAMYHDQGLSPFKAIAFEDGVNFTAGLPIIRTSPDHGTAFEMAGRDEADPRSMRSAIFKAVDIFKNRRSYDGILQGKMKERTLDDHSGRPVKPGRPQIA